MVITNDQIVQAEQLLLPEGCHFDDERKAFIKRMVSGDLMAVPGSGKTTALQAKLYCMAQQLPLKGERGILVLSHTNTAVDELKRILQRKCPLLFEYPNFVGTIQQFVDKFLAIPFYEQRYQKSVEHIDDALYDKSCEAFVVSNSRYYGEGNRSYEANYVLHHMNESQFSYKDFRFAYQGDEMIMTNGPSGNEILIEPAKKWLKENTAESIIRNIMDFLRSMKVQVLSQGILHFDDCYFLATAYLKHNPEIISVVRERFQYVFVDEAQDTQKHQLDVLTRLFDGADKVVFQMIGDPNQSIFNSHSKSMVLKWEGKNPCYIKNSIRLTQPVSNVVNNLVINKGYDEVSGESHFHVAGQRVLDQEIAPQLILYDLATKGQLEEKFSELIRAHFLLEVEQGAQHGFHIIGWAASKTNDNRKMHLEDIFPEYVHNSRETTYAIETLSKEVQNVALKGDFKASNRLVYDCFAHVLYLMGTRAADGRGFNKTKIKRTLDSRDVKDQQKFKEEMYVCVENLAKGKSEDAYNSIKAFIVYWANELYQAHCNDSANEYLGDSFVMEPVVAAPEAVENDNIHIEIGTIHSAKGRTHCATMYVETYYEGKYECQHLRVADHGVEMNPLYGDDVETKGVYATMARKMMYVGFSRPTHLLCYASLKNCWGEEGLQKMREQGWNVIDLTE